MGYGMCTGGGGGSDAIGGGGSAATGGGAIGATGADPELGALELDALCGCEDVLLLDDDNAKSLLTAGGSGVTELEVETSF
jgi:hypothetical protein